MATEKQKALGKAAVDAYAEYQAHSAGLKAAWDKFSRAVNKARRSKVVVEYNQYDKKTRKPLPARAYVEKKEELV